MQPAAVLSILVNANTSAATASLAKTDAQLKRTATTAKATSTSLGSRLGGAAKTAGKYLGMGAGVGLGYALYKGVEAGVSFEKQMDSVAAVANASAKEFKSLERQALKLGQSTAYSASEVATAQGELAKGGLAVKDILGGALPAALKLAAAGEMELGEAAETTVNSMKLFALQGRDASKIADMLATAANTTTADVSDFAMALKQGGSIAKQAGLDLNETVTVLEALAEAGIKNSDAGTSMKTAFLQLLAPTEKQKDLMEALNLNVIDQNGNLKNAAGLSGELKDALGGMTNAQQAANLKILAGTDGFRTLAALYDAGPEKLRKLSQANLEQGTAQEIAKKKLDNTAGSLEQLSGAWETLSINLFQSAQGPFRDLIDKATDALTDFTDVVTDKKLTDEEKVTKILDMIEKAISGAIPKIADAAVKMGGKIAGWVANGFLHAGFLGKLLIGASLIRLFGGPGAIGKAAGAIGARLSAGIATAAASGGVVGKAATAWQGMGRMAGKLIGPAMGLGIVAMLATDPAVQKAIKDLAGELLGAPDREKFATDLEKLLNVAAGSARFSGQNKVKIATEFGTLIFNADTEKVVKAKGKQLKDLVGKTTSEVFQEISVMRRSVPLRGLVDNIEDTGKGFEGLRGKAKRNLPDVTSELKGVATNGGTTLGKLTGFLRQGGKSFDQYEHGASKNLGKVGKSVGDFQKKGSSSYQTLSQAIRSLDSNTGSGLLNIGSNLNSLLKGLDIDPIKFNIKKAAKSVAGGIGAGMNAIGKQRGGPIDMGAPSGDTVPAMLERGEYVLNRNAVKALGKDKLDAINFGAAKRFQVGGMAGLQPGISRLAQWAGDRYGLRISSGLRSGAAGASWHNTGEAVDLVPPSMGATEGIFRAFKSQLEELFYDPWGGYDSGQMIGAIGGHMDHIHAAILGAGTGGPMSQKLKRMLLTGPDGPLQTGGQKALDMARSAANKFLAKHSMSAHGDIGIANVSGPLQAVAQRMIEQTWGGDQWPAFNELVTRESGWDPSAVNPSSGAAGLAQALPPSKYPPGAWPYTGKSSAVKQLEWMISYISGRYGTPSAALSFHDANNWYREGGIVGMQGGGGVPEVPGGGYNPFEANGGKTPGLNALTDHIQDLYGKLAHADSAKRRKKIENRIKREQRDLKKAQGHRLHKKLGRIKDNGAMSGITAEVNKRQEAVDVLTDYIGRIETQHGFTELRDVSAILEEAGIDPNVELGTLTKDQQDALTNAVNSDVAVEKGEINAEIALNYKKLVALFELRSQLIAGIEEAKERIAKALKQMEQAANAEEQARKDARKLEHSIGGLQKNLENLREKDPPARGKHESKDAYDKRIKRWKQEHQDKAVTISDRIAKQRFALSQAKVSEASARRIGETAKTSRDNLSSTSSGYLDSLNTIQGLGSPMGLNVAGAPMGAFGGEIFAVQAQLKSLGATSIKAPTLDFTPPDIPDADIPDTPGSSDSELTALKLAEALDTIRRLNVGIAQNGVFQGAFATGGVVPGKGFALVGERGPELMAVNGGERIYSNSDSRSMLKPEVRVVLEDNRTIVTVDGQVEAIVDNKLNQIARSRSYAGAGRL